MKTLLLNEIASYQAFERGGGNPSLTKAKALLDGLSETDINDNTRYQLAVIFATHYANNKCEGTDYATWLNMIGLLTKSSDPSKNDLLAKAWLILTKHKHFDKSSWLFLLRTDIHRNHLKYLDSIVPFLVSPMNANDKKIFHTCFDNDKSIGRIIKIINLVENLSGDFLQQEVAPTTKIANTDYAKKIKTIIGFDKKMTVLDLILHHPDPKQLLLELHKPQVLNVGVFTTELLTFNFMSAILAALPQNLQLSPPVEAWPAVAAFDSLQRTPSHSSSSGRTTSASDSSELAATLSVLKATDTITVN